jgi:Tfp pilus assembly protein PilF
MSNEQKEIQQLPVENSFDGPKQNDESGGGPASAPNQVSREAQLTGPVTRPTLTARISDFFSKARTIVLSIGTIVLVISICLVLFSEIRTPTVYIESFEVPDTLNKKGYSGLFLARGLIDNIIKIRTDASTWMEKKPISLGGQPALADVKVSGTTISLASLVQYLQATVGNSFKVTGDLVTLDDQVELTVRVVGRQPKTIRGPSKKLDKLLLSAAEHVMKDIEPVIFANYLDKGKRTQEAVETIKYVLRTSSRADVGRAYALWGWILADAKDFEAAATKFCRAAERDPKAAYPYEGWGWVLDELKKPNDAVKKYQKAIDLDPNSWRSFNNLCAICLNQGKLDESIAYAKRGLKLNPQEESLYYNWGLALSMQGHYKEALEKYETGFEIHNDSLSKNPFFMRDYVGMHQWWIYSLIKVGRYSDAIDKCEWALRFNPKEENLQTYKGFALRELARQKGR